MSEVRIVYSSLEDAVDYASKARTKIDNYITQIGKTINAPISNLNGSDSYGYAQSAANLASQKTNDLAAKKRILLIWRIHLIVLFQWQNLLILQLQLISHQ